jgi:hypothetical protein
VELVHLIEARQLDLPPHRVRASMAARIQAIKPPRCAASTSRRMLTINSPAGAHLAAVRASAVGAKCGIKHRLEAIAARVVPLGAE